VHKARVALLLVIALACLNVPIGITTNMVTGGSLLSVHSWWWFTEVALVLILILLAVVQWFTNRVAEPGSGADAAKESDALPSTAENLAASVRQKYMEEAERLGLFKPHPLRVRWSSTSLPVAAGVTARGGARSGDTSDLVAEFRKQSPQRLVILGEPGSGKSAAAILLALDLLASRLATDPIPVVVQIASWNPNVLGLADFLDEHLVQRYGISQGGAAELLDRNLLLPILDGLDEVPEYLRVRALEAVNSNAGKESPFVVTCRSSDYEQLVLDSRQALLNANVLELRPVAYNDVVKFLSASLPPAATTLWLPVFQEMRTTPPQNSPLVRVLSMPLMVSVAREAFTGEGWHGSRSGRLHPTELLRGRSEPEVEWRLFDALLDNAYRHERPSPRSNPRGRPVELVSVSPQRARRWLRYLARLLNRAESVEFAWWDLAWCLRQRFIYLIVALISVVVAGLMALLLSLSVTEFGIWFAALALTGAAACWYGSRRHHVYPKLLRQRPRFIAFALTFPIILSVIMAAELWLLGEFDSSYGDAWMIIELYFFGGVSYAAFFLYEELPGAESQGQLDPKRSLHDDRNATGICALLIALGFANAAMFVVANLERAQWQLALAAAIIVGLWSSTVFAATLTSWGRYRLAHVVLVITNRLPPGLFNFLEHSADRGVVRQVGSMWQFRHARLRDHLAGGVPLARHALRGDMANPLDMPMNLGADEQAAVLLAQGWTQGRAGDQDGALELTREACDLYTASVLGWRSSPWRVVTHVATALTSSLAGYSDLTWDMRNWAMAQNEVARRLAAGNKPAEASRAADQAVLIWRCLAAVDSLAEYEYLDSLRYSAWSLDKALKTERAVATARRASIVARRLSRTDNRYRSESAWALSDYGVLLRVAGNPKKASIKLWDASDQFRRLASKNDGDYDRELAITLLRRAGAVGSLDRATAALRFSLEAYHILAELHRNTASLPNRGLADALAEVSGRLYTVGRHTDAIAMAEAADEEYQRLNDDEDGEHTAMQAWSAYWLGRQLAGGGRLGEACEALERSVRQYRDLDTANWRISRDLANALTLLSFILRIRGFRSAAVPPAEEAVQIYRQLHERGWAGAQFEWSWSTMHLAAGLAANNRCSEAMQKAGVAFGGAQRSAKRLGIPRSRRSWIRNALTNVLLANAKDEALYICKRTVIKDRRLVKRDEAHRLTLARSLSTYASCLAQNGQWLQARRAAAEAIALYRPVADREPRAYSMELSATLSRLSSTLRILGHWQTAAAIQQQAIRSALGGEDSRAVVAFLAAARAGLALCLLRTGNRDAAIRSAAAAETAISQLNENNPDEFSTDFARTMTDVGIVRREAGDHYSAIECGVASLDVYRRLDKHNGSAFNADIAWCLANLVASRADAGQWSEASDEANEAMRRYQQLAMRSAVRFKPMLTWTEVQCAAVQSRLGCRDSIGLIRDAVRSYDAYCADDPVRFAPDLALALRVQASIQLQLNIDVENARAAAGRSFKIYEDLERRFPGGYRQNLERAKLVLSAAFSHE
jgi:tetratricopeptide (TPR) repeat protein